MARHRHRTALVGIALVVLRIEAVRADDPHRAVGHAVLGEREGVELDRHRIADMHEAVVAPGMLASTSSGASVGTSVMNCWPDCSTEPTETLATVSTVASRSARSSTSWRRKLRLVQRSRASDSLLVASDSLSATSACHCCT